MKIHFTNMFEYDRHANLQLFGLMAEAGYPEKPVRLMAHLLGAQQVWLSRCTGGQDFPGAVVWPEWKAGELAPVIEENNRAWLAFTGRIEDKDWAEYIAYKNSKGTSYKDRLRDIVAHVINHGTHHRAQMGQLLKRPGENLPATDYILYARRPGSVQ